MVAQSPCLVPRGVAPRTYMVHQGRPRECLFQLDRIAALIAATVLALVRYDRRVHGGTEALVFASFWAVLLESGDLARCHIRRLVRRRRSNRVSAGMELRLAVLAWGWRGGDVRRTGPKDRGLGLGSASSRRRWSTRRRQNETAPAPAGGGQLAVTNQSPEQSGPQSAESWLAVGVFRDVLVDRSRLGDQTAKSRGTA